MNSFGILKSLLFTARYPNPPFAYLDNIIAWTAHRDSYLPKDLTIFVCCCDGGRVYNGMIVLNTTYVTRHALDPRTCMTTAGRQKEYLKHFYAAREPGHVLCSITRRPRRHEFHPLRTRVHRGSQDGGCDLGHSGADFGRGTPRHITQSSRLDRFRLARKYRAPPPAQRNTLSCSEFASTCPNV